MNASSSQRNVLTIATGSQVYIDMAVNLAISFLLWNKENNIQFHLATDREELVPAPVREKINIIPVNQEEIGKSFSSKLSIDRLLRGEETLFIDSDCLIYGDLSMVFTAFKASSLSAIGYERTTGKDLGFCTDIPELLHTLNLDYFPLLCGSVYFIRKDEISIGAFQYARELLTRYDQLKLVRLRGRENEEPLLALAMAKYRQHLLPDQGWIKADRMFYTHLRSNVLEGKARLWNRAHIPVPEYSTLQQAAPLIVHYNASFAEDYEYYSEAVRLNKVLIKQWPAPVANAWALLLQTYPGRLKLLFKNALRPAYRAIFGTRKLKRSLRME